MLLSLLSRRTLEADSRDSYGFAVRPQHLHRYREYSNIFKEEEEERSKKWRKFLQQFSESAEPSKLIAESIETAEEEAEALSENTEAEAVPDKLLGHEFNGQELLSNSSKAEETKETKRKEIRTWGPIRPNLDSIQKMMCARIKNRVCLAVNDDDHVSSIQKHLPCIDEEIHEIERDKDKSLDVIDEPFFPWKTELESLVQGGVPKSLRGEVWQAFLGVQGRRVESYYQKLLSAEMDASDSSTANASEIWKKQIEKDLPRTFPGHPALDEEGRNSLRRILTAYARHNPSVGYCQAMNFFAGLLLLLMPEENAFWSLVGVIDDCFNGCYTHEMIESQVDQLVFEELMRERFPKLVNHLDYLGIEVAWISGSWFLSIFVNMLPWESVLRVWDVLLFEGNRVMLFRTALALMELYGPALATTEDAGDAVTLLQSLTGSTFDSSQLVLTACMGFLTFTEARLEELRTKHRPSVLGIIEENSKGSPVSQSSKSIASKLYSFKHDAQSLIKDPNTNKGFDGKLINSIGSKVNSSSSNFDEFMCDLSIDSTINSVPDLQEQVVWLKVELCRLMEDKRLAILRAEELETAFLEMVKQDNRLELSARVEQLEQEVALLQQALSDKQEQERAMLQVLLRVEQEQRVTEDARIAAQQEVTAQRYAVHVLQKKYEKAMASVAEMEKRVRMAESMLEATLQYESGQAKAQCSPRSAHPPESPQIGRRIGLLSFGLGWRDRNKGKSLTDEELSEGKSQSYT